ncbi:aflatoxin regulatory protein-domain-containing protein [Aspergillus carlsbadensis]|nr:aflatoxin regulatory protein-domain-containing protein [Aspergillus carlsbadensis]
MEQPTAVQQHHAPPRATIVLRTKGTQSPMQGTRKLRESCISCSRSKVKCDKQKPTCGRCVRRGLPCEFMVSRRTGRTRVIGVEKHESGALPPVRVQSTTCQPPADRLDSSIATINGDITIGQPQAQCTAERCSDLHHYLPPTMPYTPANTARASPNCTHLLSPPDEADLWTSILSPNATNSTNISSLFPFNTDPGQLATSLSPPHIDDLDAVIGELSFHVPEMPVFPDPIFTSLMEGIESSDSMSTAASSMQTRSCCFTTCLDLLLRLFPNADAGCEQSSQDGSTKLCTTESVIEDNKQILDTLQTVLECRCAEDEVLGRYTAVVRDRPLDSKDAGFSSTSTEGSSLDSRRTSVSSFEEQILHLPTVVGSYSVDGHHQSRIAAQLVLSELYRVQRVVSTVGHRVGILRDRFIGHDSYGSGSSGSSSVPDALSGLLLASGPSTSPLLPTTLNHLEEDLRTRLRAVASETIDILRRA